ncbi:MAG: ABC transporter permease [Actinomycetota bacterium]|nr:ABC transporter permease [Acidimicrobiia bacterium]MDQ3292903.1 ABC transporter permease [Actinomycetota bacterium]
MAAVTAPAVAPLIERKSKLGYAVADALTIAWRNLKGMSRTPEIIMFSTIQPIIFVLTFRYVFGGSIDTGIPGLPYVDFLMPGVFLQTVAFGAMNTGIGLADDLHKGLIERFRSLPMSRSAVLAGRALSDLVRNSGVVVLMVAVGYLVGFRIHTNVGAFLAALLLLLAFSVAFSFIFAYIGMAAPSSEAAQAGSFPILALLVFASTAFAPAEGMPGWLQAYNDVQPVSVMAKALRALMIGGETAAPVLHAVLWIVGLAVVVMPITVNKYRRAA